MEASMLGLIVQSGDLPSPETASGGSCRDLPPGAGRLCSAELCANPQLHLLLRPYSRAAAKLSGRWEFTGRNQAKNC